MDTEVRRNPLPIVEPDSPNPEWARKLDELDHRFYANSDNLTPRLEAFAREQGLVSDQGDGDSWRKHVYTQNHSGMSVIDLSTAILHRLELRYRSVELRVMLVER